MSPVTHFLTGWVVANASPSLNLKERVVITVAGVVPDIDGLGARGPDGYQWPIPYFLPFSRAGRLTWGGQWALNAWPNFMITFCLLVTTFYLAWSTGHSPLEMVSARADKAFVAALRRRFPRQSQIR